MLSADWWKPRRFRKAWHVGYAARLRGEHFKNNTYKNSDSYADYVAWRNGYYAACAECLDEHERLMVQDSTYKEDIEFLAMRAYWQGLHWDTERFTNSDENPYLSAQQPIQLLVDAWDQGRRDA